MSISQDTGHQPDGEADAQPLNGWRASREPGWHRDVGYAFQDILNAHRYEYREKGTKPDDPGWHACSCGDWEGYWSGFHPHVTDHLRAAAVADRTQRVHEIIHSVDDLRTTPDTGTGRSGDEETGVEEVVAALLESDAMTPNDDGTPTHYIVEAENVEYLVRTVLAADRASATPAATGQQGGAS